MTEYALHFRPPTTAHTVNKAKEKRRKLLEEVFARRRQNYQQYIKKLQQNLKKGKIAPSFD